MTGKVNWLPHEGHKQVNSWDHRAFFGPPTNLPLSSRHKLHDFNGPARQPWPHQRRRSFALPATRLPSTAQISSIRHATLNVTLQRLQAVDTQVVISDSLRTLRTTGARVPCQSKSVGGSVWWVSEWVYRV